jgi:hypothetical protein
MNLAPSSLPLASPARGARPVRVLLVCRDATRRRLLATATAGAADDVVLVDTLDAVDPSDYQAIVVDDEASLHEPSPLLRTRAEARPPVVVLIHTPRDSHLLPWLERLEAVHVIQFDNVQRFNDLHVTLRKITSGDIFGLHKYLAWGARDEAHTLRCTEERAALFDALERFTAGLHVHGRIRALAAVAMEEFLSNAFYNAPVDEDGAFRHRSISRTTPVTLQGDEAIAVRFCADGRRLGLSVVDPFGSLRLDNLRLTLVRGLRQGVHLWDSSLGGAGLGFYCAFESLSHLVVNVEPGRRTELIGIFSLRDSYREFLGAGRSFNMFEVSGERGLSAAEVRP